MHRLKLKLRTSAHVLVLTKKSIKSTSLQKTATKYKYVGTIVGHGHYSTSI